MLIRKLLYRMVLGEGICYTEPVRCGHLHTDTQPVYEDIYIQTVNLFIQVYEDACIWKLNLFMRTLTYGHSICFCL